MKTVPFVRRLATTLLFIAGLGASASVQARPADPFWNPHASVKSASQKPCGPKLQRAWFGPRERFVVVGDQGPCPKEAPAPKRWAGPRGTIPVYQ
ncbi:MAG: hypothetical protein ACT4PK_04975 [Gammaproteobacteria bacterium]